jgi:hypothetical protein
VSFEIFLDVAVVIFKREFERLFWLGHFILDLAAFVVARPA